MIFNTPEGMLSTEQGVYIARSVASNNMKQAKGLFKAYDNNENMENGNSNSNGRRDTASKELAGAGKKDTGKLTKKPDKQKTSKEEARDLQLREEASVREKVMKIQKNLSLLLKALGEMAITNPVFTHSELPSLVKFVNPLLHSPIVNESAYETMAKLSKCTAPPLSIWGLDYFMCKRVIDLQQEWIMTPLLDKKTLCNGLIDRCRRGDYHCLVAVGNSQEEKLEEKLYGALVLQLGLNVPKEFDDLPVEEKWQSDLKADAYVESLIVADWARRNGVGTNLMECAKRLTISKGMKQIFMRL